MNASRTLPQAEQLEVGNIVFATGGYDHSVKFWHPHDGVCYRTAQHPESVSLLINAHHTPKAIIFHLLAPVASEQAGGDA